MKYGELKILYPQVGFLKKIEREQKRVAKKEGKEFDRKEFFEKIKDRIIVDKDGNIISIDFNSIFKLENLPELDKLSKLKKLLISFNEFVSLPNLDKLTDLEVFHCTSNYITELPDLNKLKKLTKLSCSSNELSKLPNLSSLTNLKILAGFDNNFSDQEKVKIKSQVPKNCEVRI